MKTACLILLLTLPAAAQTPRAAVANSANAPRSPFWTRAQTTVQLINLAAVVADVATTREALRAPGAHEANPLARGNGLLIVKLGAVGSSIAISYALHRTHHDRAALIVPLLIAGPQFAAALHNSQIGGARGR